MFKVLDAKLLACKAQNGSECGFGSGWSGQQSHGAGWRSSTKLQRCSLPAVGRWPQMSEKPRVDRHVMQYFRKSLCQELQALVRLGHLLEVHASRTLCARCRSLVEVLIRRILELFPKASRLRRHAAATSKTPSALFAELETTSASHFLSLTKPNR